ncbi:MAG: DNAase [Herbaspirillum sp.]|nr:DNAase [Herbaspirillum sp.]
MWIDTHCHLDAAEFGGAQAALSGAAAQEGVALIVIPAIAAFNFARVAELARQYPNCVYALGVHPLLTPQAEEHELEILQQAIEAALGDPRFVAIGEIGLDYFVPELKQGALRDKQERYFVAQLKLARRYDLPVLLHVRRSQDIVLKYLRQHPAPGGIAHAFNGSFQQAERFIDVGFKLGFGGAMTFPRALQIRRLAADLPLDALVLETDAPDISPAWLHPAPNTPQQIPRIGGVLAQLRGIAPDAVARATAANAYAAMPRLAALMNVPSRN